MTSVAQEALLNQQSYFQVSYVNILEEEKSSLLREELLADFSDEERCAILRIPAAACPKDLHLLVRLFCQGYPLGCHHLEEIVYLENIRRSELLQLLDKFRDVLITCETEDPAIVIRTREAAQVPLNIS
jgi:hypothetical protein